MGTLLNPQVPHDLELRPTGLRTRNRIRTAMSELSRLAQHGAASKSDRALKVTAIALVAVLDVVAAIAFAVSGAVELRRRKHFSATQFSRRGTTT
jgi:hypothetical protein